MLTSTTVVFITSNRTSLLKKLLTTVEARTVICYHGAILLIRIPDGSTVMDRYAIVILVYFCCLRSDFTSYGKPSAK